MRLRATLVLLGLAAHLSGSAFGQTLPGTEPWDNLGDRPADMVVGIGLFLDREIAASVGRRTTKWSRDDSSPAAYERSIAPNRERFRQIIGAAKDRGERAQLEYVSSPTSPAKVAENESLSVYAVRWSVYPGVQGEGLLLEPKGMVIADIVALPDCDTTPEQFVGLAEGVRPESRVPTMLAARGCRVLVPTLIDRSDEFSGNPAVRMTNLTHREWIYRMAYETGRHIIGYEVDKVRAAVDLFTESGEKRPIGVVGYGEGGLISLYAAAVDTRIDAAWVAGYFGPREGVWKEPIYRNVWGLLDEFGDAEIASLIAPRGLVVEDSPRPVVPGPPPPRNGRADAASGSLEDRPGDEAWKEFQRALQLGLKQGVSGKLPTGWQYVLRSHDGLIAGEEALGRFLDLLGLPKPQKSDSGPLADARRGFNPRERMGRQVRQLVDYTQGLVRTSELRRSAYWSKADTKSLSGYETSIEPYREHFRNEVIGRFPPPSEPLKARTKRLYDQPKWLGYAVEMPVWPDVVASGVLLIPKDLKEGERRPVVVCQHGLEGTPDQIVDPKIDSVYHSFGARLADLGYIVYAPQNPYIGHDTFRLLQRRAHPLKKSLFAVIAGQHERTLEWLATQPNVDPSRIAFYGLSYGGKSAMRLPALLKGYCLSICSADFNEWVVKNTNIDRGYSYMFTLEYDMYEFALAEGFNYAEMAALIAPRPFQVERGHQDMVAPDEWIGYEFAKVRRLYDTLNIPERADITYFNDGHQIEGKGTFAFLAKHLHWPESK